MGYGEAPWIFKGRALYQLQLVKSEDARQHIPESFKLVELFGYTLGGFYLARYDNSPVGAFDELVALAGLVWNPPTSCAWAARVYVNNREARDHGLKSIGLPSRLASFSARPQPAASAAAGARTGATNWWWQDRPAAGATGQTGSAVQALEPGQDLCISNIDSTPGRALQLPVCSMALPAAHAPGAGRGPQIRLALPSFSGGTPDFPSLVSYSCNLMTRVMAVPPAVVTVTSGDDGEATASGRGGSSSGRGRGSRSSGGTGSPSELMATVLGGRPVLALAFDEMVMTVEEPVRVEQRAPEPVKAARPAAGFLGVIPALGLPQHASTDAALTEVLRKVSWRLLPLFFVMVLLCYIDRTNLAFAAMQLATDLNFGPAIFGLGSGVFFLGYALCQIPSNLLLKRLRPSLYLPALIACWGVCACAFAAMRTPTQFLGLRLLLGVAEAGAFPGMWYYLSLFYPSDQLTLPYAIVDSGISLSHVIAAPLAAACLALTGVGGLRGWQHLFLIEGAPTLLLALVFWRYLPDSPEDARFLEHKERALLLSSLTPASGGKPAFGRNGSSSGSDGGSAAPLLPKAHVHATAGQPHGAAAGSLLADLWAALRNKYVWYLGMAKLVKDVAGFGVIFWTPTVVNSLIQGTTSHFGEGSPAAGAGQGHGGGHGGGDGGVQAALLTAVPFALAAGCSYAIARRSQAVGEKVMHIAVPFCVCGAVYALFPWAAQRSPLLGFGVLTVGVIGVYSGSGTCIALLQELSAGPGFLVAGPLWNSIGNIGGFIGPYVVGLLLERTQSFAIPSLVMAVCLFLSGLIVALMPRLLPLPPGVRVGLGLWGPWAAAQGKDDALARTDMHKH